MTEGEMLIHPNEIFLLDHNFNWRATLIGTDWSYADLQVNIKRIEDPGLWGWLAMHPAKLALAGFVGLVLNLGLILGWLISRKTRRLSAPT